MDKEKIISNLDACLATEDELSALEWSFGYDDKLPIQRTPVLK